MFTLTTDLIVGSAPPERAGAASAISETSAEFGGALGIAVLGSIGTAVYRGAMADAMPAGVPPEAAEAARDTLGGAVAAAEQLPDRWAPRCSMPPARRSPGAAADAAISAAVALADGHPGRAPAAPRARGLRPEPGPKGHPDMCDMLLMCGEALTFVAPHPPVRAGFSLAVRPIGVGPSRSPAVARAGRPLGVARGRDRDPRGGHHEPALERGGPARPGAWTGTAVERS